MIHTWYKSTEKDIINIERCLTDEDELKVDIAAYIT